jgi:hypothetical protein
VIRFFRRQRPAPPPPRLTPDEAITASAWGYTEQGWLNLTPQDRAKARTDLTKAPRFTN